MGAALREHIKGYGGTGRRGRRPLQRNLQNMRRGGRLCPPVSPFSSAWAGGVEPRPYAGQDDFHKNVIPRSAATWESVFPCVRGAVQGYYGLPHQPAGWFAMTGFFGSAARIERRGVGDADPYAHLVGGRCGRDDGGIVSYGNNQAPCRTERLSSGGTHGYRPTEDQKRNSAGGRSPFSDCIVLRSRRCPRCGDAAPRRGCCSRP